MSDEEKTDVNRPHGVQQSIKMELLGMIHSAENPFDIIIHIAKYLEKESAEDGYAQHIIENIRSVYGLALGDAKLLQDELKDVEARYQKISAAKDNPNFSEEEKQRIGFAVNLHKKNIERLKELIHKAELEGTDPIIEK